MNDFADWTTDELRDYEERLYDREVTDGEDTWFERDAVLAELNYRGRPL